MRSDAANTASGAKHDVALAESIARGDHTAFEQIMRRYNRRLFRLACASLGDVAEAEDALQDAYLQVHRSIGGFRGEAALSTWLSRLVLNECLARRRRQTRRENVIPLVRAEDNVKTVCAVADDSPVPERAVGQQQLRAILERKVSELPEAFRLVFVLRSVEEMDVGEVAQTLDIPEETVRSRHFRARTLLRESLTRDADMAERDLFDFGGARCDRVVARVLACVTEEATGPRELSSPVCYSSEFE